MDTSREIKEDSSFNMTLLILVIGLVGIGGALLLNNIPLFGMIIALPLLCITCILLLKSLVHTICHFYDQLFHIGYYPIYSNRRR